MTVETGDLISDSRSSVDDLYRVVYMDDCRVLMRSNNRHERTGRREYRSDFRDSFEDYIKSGRYSVEEECDEAPSIPEVASEEIEWSEIDGIGSITERKLREAGIETDHDVATTDDEYLIDVYGMSETKLERMKEFINE